MESNRSLHHRGLFSRFTQALERSERERILAHYYAPHRARVEAALRAALREHTRVLHVAVHSFTPELDGKVRNAELGILYDPRRPHERKLALRWQAELSAQGPYRVRRNYPYHGAADGLTTHLRRLLGPRYLGFELEINPRVLLESARARQAVAQLLSASMAKLVR